MLFGRQTSCLILNISRATIDTKTYHFISLKTNRRVDDWCLSKDRKDAFERLFVIEDESDAEVCLYL